MSNMHISDFIEKRELDKQFEIKKQVEEQMKLESRDEVGRTITLTQFVELLELSTKTDYIGIIIQMKKDGLITEATMKNMLLSAKSKYENGELSI